MLENPPRFFQKIITLIVETCLKILFDYIGSWFAKRRKQLPGQTNDYDIAIKFLRKWEGYQSQAYWDVNAWRNGYGSDTMGAKQTRVKRYDKTTREDAEANLSVRLPQFERTIIKQCGLKQWKRLSPNTQGALLSFCYNYGKLTQTLTDTIKRNGSRIDISSAVYARRFDNNSVNKNRREAEAKLIVS
ncbi:MAG: lysozyme [Nitrososphaera sp.]